MGQSVAPLLEQRKQPHCALRQTEASLHFISDDAVDFDDRGNAQQPGYHTRHQGEETLAGVKDLRPPAQAGEQEHKQ